ncbi:MAG: RcpC/CpaB family pilus assembly protein [Actinobacteria bacterium]|nr:RcpC/CpaB family pilus assembly protein [Actinomycetota bacterium]
MTHRPSLVTREAGTSQPAGRRGRRRLSASHVLVALAVVLAFVLNILALQDRSASVLVAVADTPLAAGSVFSPGMARLVPIPTDFDGLSTMVVEDHLVSYEGWVLQRAIPEGGVIDVTALAQPAAGEGLRAMSIPVEVTRAAGGTVVTGDRVDVITVRDGVAVYVVADVEVVSVPAEDTSGFGSSEHHLVLAVDAEQALALAEAVAAGPIDVIRSTGAPPVATGVVQDES